MYATPMSCVPRPWPCCLPGKGPTRDPARGQGSDLSRALQHMSTRGRQTTGHQTHRGRESEPQPSPTTGYTSEVPTHPRHRTHSVRTHHQTPNTSHSDPHAGSGGHTPPQMHPLYLKDTNHTDTCKDTTLQRPRPHNPGHTPALRSSLFHKPRTHTTTHGSPKARSPRIPR